MELGFYKFMLTQVAGHAISQLKPPSKAWQRYTSVDGSEGSIILDTDERLLTSYEVDLEKQYLAYQIDQMRVNTGQVLFTSDRPPQHTVLLFMNKDVPLVTADCLIAFSIRLYPMDIYIVCTRQNGFIMRFLADNYNVLATR